MRHRHRGRKLGRNPNHQRALLRSLASALILTERDADGEENAPKVRGRIVTTLMKAKEVRPLVEKCVTIARRSLEAKSLADTLVSDAPRNSEAWRTWRNSSQWNDWAKATAPVVNARRRVLQLLGDKQAVRILFETIAPRFEERSGGYTRILHLAKPRLGDSAPRAILEFVGVRDRVRRKAPQRPAIEPEAPPASPAVAPEEPAADKAESASPAT